MTEYAYASGNLLENPNTYFYTPFLGVEFLKTWKVSRDSIAAKLKHRASAARLYDQEAACASNLQYFKKKLETTEGVSTAELLASVYSCLEKTPPPFTGDLQYWLERLVKKFEITKRIHASYGKGFKAVEPSQCRDLALYVGLAEIFSLAYVKTHRLIFLNSLLKLMDTLCALEKKLSDALAGALVALIQQEAGFTEMLTSKKMESRRL